MYHVIHKIIKQRNAIQPNGTPLISGEHWIEKNDLTKIYPITRSPIKTPLIFIDGGMGDIITFPDGGILLMRAASITAHDDTFITSCSTYIGSISNNVSWLFELFDTKGTTLFTQQLDDVNNYQEACACACRITELFHMYQQTISPKSIIVIDGCLETQYQSTNQTQMMLNNKAQQYDTLVIGCSKSTSLKTSQGITLVRHAIDHLTVMGYLDVGIRNDIHVCMARLHENAHYAIRIDISNKPYIDIPRIMGMLATLSNDIGLLGYPYPAIKADMIARISNEEINCLRTSIHSQCNEKTRKENSHAAFHSILDTMRY